MTDTAQLTLSPAQRRALAALDDTEWRTNAVLGCKAVTLSVLAEHGLADSRAAGGISYWPFEYRRTPAGVALLDATPVPPVKLTPTQERALRALDTHEWVPAGHRVPGNGLTLETLERAGLVESRDNPNGWRREYRRVTDGTRETGILRPWEGWFELEAGRAESLGRVVTRAGYELRRVMVADPAGYEAALSAYANTIGAALGSYVDQLTAAMGGLLHELAVVELEAQP